MKIVLFVCLFLYLIAYFFYDFLTSLKILQLEEYKAIRLLKYKFKHNKIYLLFSMLGLSLLFINNTNLRYILISVYLIINTMFITFFNSGKNFKFKITHRIIRIMCIFIVLIIFIVLPTFLTNNSILLSITIVIIPNTIQFLTILSNFLTKIFEKLLLNFYIKKAQNKLKKSNLTKIAITGTYAKTSVKNILATILSEKYAVLSTPKSYNTPSGLALTINNNNLSNYDVLIMEMGAKKKGDIKYLCKNFQPNFGILTSIGKQHLQTFKTIDEIINAKSELSNYLANGFMVFNINNCYVGDISNNYIGQKITVGEAGDVNARILKVDETQSKFEIYYHAKLFALVETTLAGLHNIENILVAVAMAIKLGLTPNQIKAGVAKLKPVESRMEKTILNNGAIVINNGYNSNPDSAQASLKYLLMFEGKKKVVITPGFVEMGKEQYDLNYNFARDIATLADCCIIVKQTNREALENGLTESNFVGELRFVGSFKDVDFKTFDNDTVILIENDLPDNYD